MICPRCEGEFAAVVTECPSCRVPLVEHLDKPEENAPTEWVTIAKIANPSELMVLKSMLQSSGIPVFVPGEHSFQQIPALHLLRHTTFRGGECELQVPGGLAEEARSLLAALPGSQE